METLLKFLFSVVSALKTLFIGKTQPGTAQTTGLNHTTLARWKNPQELCSMNHSNLAEYAFSLVQELRQSQIILAEHKTANRKLVEELKKARQACEKLNIKHGSILKDFKIIDHPSPYLYLEWESEGYLNKQLCVDYSSEKGLVCVNGGLGRRVIREVLHRFADHVADNAVFTSFPNCTWNPATCPENKTGLVCCMKPREDGKPPLTPI
jgi:hypothetical protein